MSDDFYVGYLPSPPRGIVRFVRRTAILVAAGMAGIAALLAALQRPFDHGVFEYGETRELAGRVEERPYPRLLVARRGRPASGASPTTSVFLTRFGKGGADELVAGLEGREVSLRGALIYRDGPPIAEIEEGSVVDAGMARTAPEPTVDLGRHQLVGEIVDSKCWSGVMKPGAGKPHRSCAARCLSGGVPPYFVAETDDGQTLVFLLLTASGERHGDALLDRVAEPVRITGRVRRLGDVLRLEADLAGIDRL